MHVVNHLTGEEQPHPRNVLEETARIARGNVANNPDNLLNNPIISLNNNPD